MLPRVEAELRAQGVEPNFVFRSDIIGTVQALVGAGVGNAIVPRLAVDFADRQVSVVELGADVPVQPRVIALFWHRDRYRSPAALGFVEAARRGLRSGHGGAGRRRAPASAHPISVIGNLRHAR